MIIDGHMHIGKQDLISADMVDFLKKKGIWDKMKYWLSLEGVIEALDEAGIEKGVIFPLTFPNDQHRMQDLNDLTASYVQAQPQRLIGYAVIHPKQIEASLRELDRAINQLKLSGIKLHPSMQEFYPNDPNFAPIFEYAQEKQIVVLCHTGAATSSHVDKYSCPIILDEIAVKFPRVHLIIAHAGRPFYAEAALLLRKHTNVYADISANVGRRDGEALLSFVLLALQVYAGAARRLIFGSDYPIFSPKEFLEQFQRAIKNSLAEKLGLTAISNEEADSILGQNLADILSTH